jgi:hypothetical protein
MPKLLKFTDGDTLRVALTWLETFCSLMGYWYHLNNQRVLWDGTIYMPAPVCLTKVMPDEWDADGWMDKVYMMMFASSDGCDWPTLNNNWVINLLNIYPTAYRSVYEAFSTFSSGDYQVDPCDGTWIDSWDITISPPSNKYSEQLRALATIGVVLAATVSFMVVRAKIRVAFAVHGSNRVRKLQQKYDKWINCDDEREAKQIFADLYKSSRRYNWFASLWGLGQFNPTAGFTTTTGLETVGTILGGLQNIKVNSDDMKEQTTNFDLWRLITGVNYPNLPN